MNFKTELFEFAKQNARYRTFSFYFDSGEKSYEQDRNIIRNLSLILHVRIV